MRPAQRLCPTLRLLTVLLLTVGAAALWGASGCAGGPLRAGSTAAPRGGKGRLLALAAPMD